MTSFGKRTSAPVLPGADGSSLGHLSPPGGKPYTDRFANLMAGLGVVINLMLMVLSVVAMEVVAKLWGHDAFQAATFLGMGGAMVLMAASQAITLRPFMRNREWRYEQAIEVPGSVIALPKSSGKKTGDPTTPTVRFATTSGAILEESAALSPNGLEVGQAIRVRYDPADPSWVVVAGPDPMGMRLLLLCIVGFGLFGLPVLASGAYLATQV